MNQVFVKKKIASVYSKSEFIFSFRSNHWNTFSYFYHLNKYMKIQNFKQILLLKALYIFKDWNFVTLNIMAKCFTKNLLKYWNSSPDGTGWNEEGLRRGAARGQIGAGGDLDLLVVGPRRAEAAASDGVRAVRAERRLMRVQADVVGAQTARSERLLVVLLVAPLPAPPAAALFRLYELGAFQVAWVEVAVDGAVEAHALLSLLLLRPSFANHTKDSISLQIWMKTYSFFTSGASYSLPHELKVNKV
jgi:hypothetical protein